MGSIPPNIKLIPMTQAEFEHQVYHSSLIDIEVFKPLLAVLASIAFICFLARITIRVVTRRRLYLDDGFLCLAAAALCVSTALIYHYCFLWFLMNAAQREMRLIITEPFMQGGYLTKLENSPGFRNAFAVMNWTTIFSVKFCFFAFFHPLIRHSRGLTIYYWISVVFSVLGYGFCCSEAFVFNKFANDDREVAHNRWYSLSIAYTISVTIFDGVSDLMIVSIPILLLRKSRLRRSNKLSVSFFLCLSIFMVMCCIVRASGYLQKGSPVPDLLWRIFWQQVECYIAVMMASITVFRTLFTAGSQQQKEEEQDNRPSHISRLFPRFLIRSGKAPLKGSPDSSQDDKEGVGYLELPTMPSSTFTGIRSFIRKHQRTGPTSTMAASTTAESVFDPLEVDYHAQLRRGTSK